MALEDVDTDEVPTDEELTALALAADPDAPIADGAVPIGIHLAQLGFGAATLVHASRRQPRKSSLEGALRDRHGLLTAFLLIDLMGLCNTYGILSWA